jgi:hypothetical protein
MKQDYPKAPVMKRISSGGRFFNPAAAEFRGLEFACKNKTFFLRRAPQNYAVVLR